MTKSAKNYSNEQQRGVRETSREIRPDGTDAFAGNEPNTADGAANGRDYSGGDAPYTRKSNGSSGKDMDRVNRKESSPTDGGHLGEDTTLESIEEPSRRDSDKRIDLPKQLEEVVQYIPTRD